MIIKASCCKLSRTAKRSCPGRRVLSTATDLCLALLQCGQALDCLQAWAQAKIHGTELICPSVHFAVQALRMAISLGVSEFCRQHQEGTSRYEGSGHSVLVSAADFQMLRRPFFAATLVIQYRHAPDLQRVGWHQMQSTCVFYLLYFFCSCNMPRAGLPS